MNKEMTEQDFETVQQRLVSIVVLAQSVDHLDGYLRVLELAEKFGPLIDAVLCEKSARARSALKDLAQLVLKVKGTSLDLLAFMQTTSAETALPDTTTTTPKEVPPRPPGVLRNNKPPESIW